MEQINLNYIPGGIYPVVHCSQGDVGRKFKINLFEGDNTFTLDGTETISISGYKTDGNVFIYDLPNTTSNYIEVTLEEQMTACNGDVICEIIIEKGDTKIGTCNFVLQCEQSPTSLGPVSKSTLDAIDAIIEVAKKNVKDSEASAKASAQSAVESANSAQSSANSAQSSANSASQSQTYANNSSISATQSANSASASAKSEANAKVSEDNSKASEEASAISETNAHNYANQASTSATNAQNYASECESFASSASTSASQALASKNAAKISEDNAKASEKSISDMEGVIAGYANSASASATSASESENSASESASQASASATSASESANQASASKTSASESASSASASAIQASESKESASESTNSAFASANQASESASQASTSASQASESASQASTSASQASTSAGQALASASQASTSATVAQKALENLQNTTVSSTTLAPGSSATATKTVASDGKVNIAFGIPQGIQGEKGDKGESSLVIANPTTAATEDLTKIEIDGNVYNIAGGTNVIANPTTSSTKNLTKIEIDGETYNIDKDVEWADIKLKPKYIYYTIYCPNRSSIPEIFEIGISDCTINTEKWGSNANGLKPGSINVTSGSYNIGDKFIVKSDPIGTTFDLDLKFPGQSSFSSGNITNYNNNFHATILGTQNSNYSFGSNANVIIDVKLLGYNFVRKSNANYIHLDFCYEVTCLTSGSNLSIKPDLFITLMISKNKL